MVGVIAVDDFLFVRFAPDVPLDIRVAKSPLYAPHTRHFSGPNAKLSSALFTCPTADRIWDRCVLVATTMPYISVTKVPLRFSEGEARGKGTHRIKPYRFSPPSPHRILADERKVLQQGIAWRWDLFLLVPPSN